MHAFENALLLIVLIVGGVFIFVSILLFQKADGILKTPILRKLGAHNATVKNVREESSILETFYNNSIVQYTITFFKNNRIMEKSMVLKILNDSYYQHLSLPNLIQVRRNVNSWGNLGSFTVSGDTHGQFFDFIRIFNQDVGGGLPTHCHSYLFNGDMVDRGQNSVEIVLTLLIMKLTEPKAVYILRGNHETIEINSDYGFKEEVLRKYDKKVFQMFNRLFSVLPAAAVFERSVFIVHGGLGLLSAEMEINTINTHISRNSNQPVINSALYELLWSDPRDGMTGLAHNKARGGGYIFGQDVTEKFLNRNNLSWMIRSHEVQMEGFKRIHGDKIITLFSAPNYCGQYGNKAAIIRFEAHMKPPFLEPRIIQFT